MARIMGLPKPDTAPRCLACHALDVPVDQRARTFDLTDGVGCENCHGPASAWLGPHTTRSWNYDKSLELGMYNTRDLIQRSERCLSCHLGTSEKTVDHELIAAGHPDLYFELDSFMSVMPPHWKEADKDPWLGVRALSVGQAVQLREQLKRVARESSNGIWPEYAELDCFACHHSLTATKDSWRQERGYAGRRPGNTPWNLSRYVVLRHVIEEADAAGAQQLKSEVDKVYSLVTSPGSDRKQIAAQASSASEVADRLARRASTLKYDQPMTLRLMKSIAGDADFIAEQGERAAEQATMALDSLFIAYTSNGSLANDQQIRAAIHGLFQQLEDPSAYNGFTFSRQMKNLHSLLP
jgi:Cytochrome c554 and c-prime